VTRAWSSPAKREVSVVPPCAAVSARLRRRRMEEGDKGGLAWRIVVRSGRVISVQAHEGPSSDSRHNTSNNIAWYFCR